MAIRTVKMGATRKIVQLPRNHHTKPIWRHQHAMTGCSNAETIDACRIGGNAMALMTAAMAAMRPVVPITQCRRPYQRPPFKSNHVCRINSCAIREDVWPNRMSAMVSQIAQMAKTNRIARTNNAVEINSGESNVAKKTFKTNEHENPFTTISFNAFRDYC